jgi:hyperosmotically inducible protein
MKSKFIILVSATTLSCLPIFADQLGDTNNNTVNTVPRAAQSQRDRDEYQSGRMQRLGDLRKANKIIGEEITDDQGQKLGKVKDLAIDLQNGRIVEVIMATGGVLGMDQKLIAVPPSSFTCDKTMSALRLNADKEQLKNAPEFKMSDWNNSVERDQVREVYQRYGAQPYFVTGQQTWRNQTTGSANETIATPSQGQTTNNYSFPNQSNTPHTQRADDTQPTRDAVQPNGTYSTTTTNDNNTVQTGTHIQRDNDVQNTRDNIEDTNVFNGQRDYAMAGSNYRPVQMGNVVRASSLMGTEAMGNDDQKIGKINNFIVDLPAGRVVEVILSSGGFLGMDAELIPVPPQALQWNADNTAVTLNTSRDSLKSSPHFKSSEWGYANEPANITEVYTTYHVPAYFNGTEVDNTRQNVRDRSGQTMTPMDQGNDRADIDTTAQIRKAIMADSSLSTDARNVKIITNNGQVTLRGVVDSDSEKQTVANAANGAANGAHVDDQLQVRNASDSSGTAK